MNTFLYGDFEEEDYMDISPGYTAPLETQHWIQTTTSYVKIETIISNMVWLI